jgi:hypothetical protein
VNISNKRAAEFPLRAIFTLVLTACAIGANALDLEVGAGMKIDPAPYGIERVAAVALVAPWVDIGHGLQVGMIAAGSAGGEKADIEASACLRAWPEGSALSLFEGCGIFFAFGQDQLIVPMIIGGIRIGTGSWAVQSGIEIDIEATGTDTLLWIVLTRRIAISGKKLPQ